MIAIKLLTNICIYFLISRLDPPSHNDDECRLPGDTSALIPEMAQIVSKEVEDEANSYFQRIYNHPPHPTLSIDEVLEMLNKFKDSTNKRERVTHLFSFFCLCFLYLLCLPLILFKQH